MAPTLEEIELAVAVYFGIRRTVAVPNVSWGMDLHECDVLVLRPSGLLVEVEIKRSLSDLKKDADKHHGHIDRKNRIRELWFALPVELVEKGRKFVPEGAGVLAIQRHPGGRCQARVVEPARRNTKARALTPTETQQFLRLGCLRVWALKNRLITYHGKHRTAKAKAQSAPGDMD